MDTITSNKRFGKSGLNREMFLDCFAESIDMSGLTDEQMQKFADYVEEHIRILYPETADKMFELWAKEEERTDEEQDFLDFECYQAEELWWDTVEKVAVGEIGMKYYEDMN